LDFKLMKIAKYLVISIFVFTVSNSCMNKESKKIDVDLVLEEGEEKLMFQGEYVDFEMVLNFDLYKLKYFLELSFENNIIDHFNNSDKTLKYFSDQIPENSTEKMYNMFLNDPADLYLLEGLLETVRNRSIGDKFDMVQLLVAFVQSIPYEIAESQKYPYETLYLNKGDCSDKSVLLCKLLILEGYEACLLSYDKAKHMAVGLKIDNEEESYYSGYCYIESTAISPIGEIPKELVGGIKIDEDPEIIYPYENGENAYQEISNLKLFYKEVVKEFGKSYLQSSIKEKKLLEEMKHLTYNIDSLRFSQNSIKTTLDSLKRELKKRGCEGAVSENLYGECIEINKAFNARVENFNQLNLSIINSNKIYNKKVTLLNSLKR